MPRRTVLLVDDEPTILRFVSMLLAEAGFEVYPAADAREAVALAQQHPFDVVVVDYGQPEMDGAQTLLEIRKARPGVPAIFTSGRISPELQAEADRQGALVLEKPYRVPALVESIERVLGLSPAPP